MQKTIISTDRQGTSDAGHASMILYAAILTLVLLFAYFTPRGESDVAVLVSPFSARDTAALTVARANGLIVDGARWPCIVLAQPVPGGNHPAFVTRLYQAGALIVFSPGIMAGCFKKE